MTVATLHGHAVTVAELIEQLRQLPQDAPVWVCCWASEGPVEAYKAVVVEHEFDGAMPGHVVVTSKYGGMAS